MDKRNDRVMRKEIDFLIQCKKKKKAMLKILIKRKVKD